MGSQRSEKKNIVFGLLLIFIGLLLFAGIFLRVNFISMHYLWPLFVLIPGLLFELSYFIERRAPGILIPGGILMTIGLLFSLKFLQTGLFRLVPGRYILSALLLDFTNITFLQADRPVFCSRLFF